MSNKEDRFKGLEGLDLGNLTVYTEMNNEICFEGFEKDQSKHHSQIAAPWISSNVFLKFGLKKTGNFEQVVLEQKQESLILKVIEFFVQIYLNEGIEFAELPIDNIYVENFEENHFKLIPEGINEFIAKEPCKSVSDYKAKLEDKKLKFLSKFSERRSKPDKIVVRRQDMTPKEELDFDDSETQKVRETRNWIVRKNGLVGETVHLKMQHPQDTHLKNFLFKEHWYMSELKGDYVVNYYGIVEIEANYALITEECWSLSDYIKARDSNMHDYSLHVKIVKELLQGCKFIHSKEIIHNNINLDSIFIDSNLKTKLGEGGLCCRVQSPTRSGHSIFYSSPELLSPDSELDFFSDIWSIGMVIYTLLVGKHPFYYLETPPSSPQEMHYLIGTKKYRPMFDYEFELQHPELVMLMRQTWHSRPYKRPTIDELITMFESAANSYL